MDSPLVHCLSAAQIHQCSMAAPTRAFCLTIALAGSTIRVLDPRDLWPMKLCRTGVNLVSHQRLHVLLPEPICAHTDYEIGISDDSPQEFTSCSECECILDSIKYTCTTCSGKTPMTRPTLLAAEAKGKDRDRAASTGTSPTRTVVGRGPNSSVSSSSTARAGYELCGACFGTVAVNHSWVFCVPGSFSIPKEKARLSQPKQTGLLRHAFVEKVWNLHWKDVGALSFYETFDPRS